MTKRGSARFTIESDEHDKPLIIRDIGGDNCWTVTNDAEAVVAKLMEQRRLTPGRRLYYYDSMGDMDELLIKDGRFAGFAPGPGRR